MKSLQFLSISIGLLLLIFANTSCKTTQNTTSISNLTYKHEVLNLTKDDANQLYEQMVDSCIDNPSGNFYTKLRLAHAAGSSYAPYSEDKNLKKIQTLIDENQYEVAIEVVKTVHRNLFYNPEFHFYAYIVWSETDNDDMAGIHKYYYSQLIESVLSSGDGKSPQTAYQVISISEEYRTISYLDMKSKEQSLLNIDGHNFDMMKVKDSNKKTKEIYFNIDLPFNHLSGMFDE